MAWWVVLIIYAASMVLSGLLMKAPKVKASSLGDLQAPTAQEGRNIPVIFGTCCLRAPNVVWYGDYKAYAIKKSMGVMAFGKKATIGYNHYLGMNLALCHGPVDALVDVLFGSGEDLEPIYWIQQGSNSDGSLKILINDPKFFGGSGQGSWGGIIGQCTFYFGSQTQGSDAYMSSRLGTAYPAYHGLCHLVCGRLPTGGHYKANMYWGDSTSISNMALVLRRCPDNLGLSGSLHSINGDANPAEIIYEILTSKVWGLGFPAARIDIASFIAAGETLAAEGMGMSLQIDSQQSADDVITTVLQHIDGVCYTDPSTGLWTLQLVRAVDPSTLQEFGPDDISEAEFTRGSWDQTVNEVKVKYTNRSTWKDAMVQAQETANFATREELASVEMDFPGFSNATIAQKIATRELRMQSYPMGHGRVKVNRKAWQWRMGTPFLFTWPALGIDRMPVRVTSITYGSLESGAIEAEIVEDLFNVTYSTYSPPSGSAWQDPIGDPEAPAAQMAIEAPYQMLDGAMAPRILVGAVRANGTNMGYQVWTDDGSGYQQTNDVPAFCPSGLLQAAYARNTAALDPTGFTLSGIDLDDLTSSDAAGRDRGYNLLYFADTGEICAWQNIVENEDGTFTISGIVRGVYDTLPTDHASGARVLFIRCGAFDYLADHNAGLLEDSGDDSELAND